MIPLIQNEIVNNKGWIDEEEFLDALAVAQSSPGPIAINTAIFVGIKVAGKVGMFFSILGSALPSFIIILIIAIYFSKIKDSEIFLAIFKGIKPAVIALIFAPVFTMAKKIDFNNKKILYIIIVAVGVAIGIYRVSPIVFIIASMIIGNLYYECVSSKGDKK